MPILDYASPSANRVRRRLSGDSILAAALVVGAVPALFTRIEPFGFARVFGPICPGGSGRLGDFPNPLAILASLVFVGLTIFGVRRRIDDEDAHSRVRKPAATTAIVVTAICFCGQFGNAPRDDGDTLRLYIAGATALVCSIIFLFSSRRRTEAVADWSFRDGWLAWLKHRPAACMLLLLLVVVCLIPVGQLALRWLARYRNEQRAMKWHQLARSHQFAPMVLRYTENPADVSADRTPVMWLMTTGPDGKPGMMTATTQTATGASTYGSRHVSIGPELDPVPSMSMLFAHERQNPAGQRAVVVASLGDLAWPTSVLNIEFQQLREGTTLLCYRQGIPFDTSTLCKPGEIRIFGGQIDPNDSSRFFIPFQTLRRSGRLVVTWIRPIGIGPGDYGYITETEERFRSVTIDIEFDSSPATRAAAP